jgi:hypothetical protein
VSGHSEGETHYHSPIFDCRQYTRDSREHHAEQSASPRPRASLDGPTRSDVRESELDKLSITRNLLESESYENPPTLLKLPQSQSLLVSDFLCAAVSCYY